MLELFGRGYVIDHCVDALKKAREEKALRVYVTDALQIIADNGTHFIIPGHGAVDYGRTLNKRWIDLINPPPEKPEDPRSCEEITADIWKRIRGEAADK